MTTQPLCPLGRFCALFASPRATPPAIPVHDARLSGSSRALRPRARASGILGQDGAQDVVSVAHSWRNPWAASGGDAHTARAAAEAQEAGAEDRDGAGERWKRRPRHPPCGSEDPQRRLQGAQAVAGGLGRPHLASEAAARPGRDLQEVPRASMGKLRRYAAKLGAGSGEKRRRAHGFPPAGLVAGATVLLAGGIWAYWAEMKEQKRIESSFKRYKKLEDEFMNVEGQAQTDDDLADELRKRTTQIQQAKDKKAKDNKSKKSEGEGKADDDKKNPPPPEVDLL
eukprot:scaffold736_cov254-Pinguiococcus_pyrenoidosus.AAC.32